jgi:glycosyltransferase involved in cell wall biosynthesis
LPTLVLEAMAQAKPVVVSKEPGSMEAIDHGAYGYFYELGNLEDLKQKTLLAIHDSKIGKRARQRVLEEYDWRLVAKKLDAIYKGDVQQ